MNASSIETAFLARLARGGLIDQDEYNQMVDLLPLKALANALAQRFDCTNETSVLVEAARLYLHGGFYYQALEVCSRAQNLPALEKVIQQALPHIRADYPDIPVIGKLLDEAFLVINLSTGRMLRFPPLMPARG